MSLLKIFLKYIFVIIPKKYISRLGFVNYYIPHINGPRDRLILQGDYSGVRLVNTIFNTMSGSITLEKDIFFGANCMLLTGKHNYLKCDKDVVQNRNIFIGSGSWLASGCIVLGNVTIGKNCVICAGAVVTNDIPDYSVAAGIPAKVIKTIQ